MWGIFYIVLSIAQNIVMDVINVMTTLTAGGGGAIVAYYCKALGLLFFT